MSKLPSYFQEFKKEVVSKNARVVVIRGSDQYFITKASDILRHEFLSEFNPSVLKWYEITKKDYPRLLDELRQPTWGGATKVVFVDQSFLKHIKKKVKISRGVLLVIFTKSIREELLKKFPTTVIFDAKLPPFGAKLTNFIKYLGRDNNLVITKEDTDFVIRTLGRNANAIDETFFKIGLLKQLEEYEMTSLSKLIREEGKLRSQNSVNEFIEAFVKKDYEKAVKVAFKVKHEGREAMTVLYSLEATASALYTLLYAIKGNAEYTDSFNEVNTQELDLDSLYNSFPSKVLDKYVIQYYQFRFISSLISKSLSMKDLMKRVIMLRNSIYEGSELSFAVGKFLR